MKIAICVIAKDEDNYIEEWATYHRKLGFDAIYVYANDWDMKFDADYIVQIPCNGKVMQLQSYAHFIDHYKDEYDYVAFIDVDEFIVLKKHKNIHELMEDYKQYNGLALNWVLFGDNGLKMNGNFSVLERFTKRQIGVDQHIKCIVNPKVTKNMWIHCPIDLLIADTDENMILNSPFNPVGKDDIAYIAHFFCKTRGEFQQKINKGRADDYTRRNFDDFNRHNYNVITDLTALNFYKQ